MRHLAWWWCAAACAALGDAPPPPRYEVPKVAVAEALLAGDGNGTLAEACGPPSRLGGALLERLYFYAFVTTDDPELLEHFLEFYDRRGVDFAAPGRSRIYVNPGLNKTNAKDRRVHRILLTFVKDAYGANVRSAPVFSSDIKRDLANDFLRELPRDGLLMFPDLDEFFDAPPALVEASANAYGGFVLGHMVDRVARDWRLSRMHRRSKIWGQYPLRCAATHERFHASNMKWIVVPKRDPWGNAVKFTSAHHVNAERRFDDVYRRMPSHAFSHYRFGGHSYDLLKRKHGVYLASGNPRAHIYGVILSYVDHAKNGTSRLNDEFRKKVRCGAPCPGKAARRTSR